MTSKYHWDEGYECERDGVPVIITTCTKTFRRCIRVKGSTRSWYDLSNEVKV